MKSDLKSRVIMLFAAVFLAGCATSGGPVAEDPSITVADLKALPAPDSSGFAPGSLEEVVRPLDVVSVVVFGVPELSREALRVGLDGTFDFPLIGAVDADGHTLREVAQDMEARLAGTYVRDPDIQLSFVSREGQVFTIGGEVKIPGQYPIIRPMTLMQAVALGQGRTEFSQLREVMIFREVDDQRYIGVYDLRGIQRGNYQDPAIYPSDVIMVGESAGARRLTMLAQFAPLVVNPLILLDRAVR